MADPDRRFKSRKFGIACAVLISATGLLIAGQIDAGQWVEIVKWDVGLYMAGNIGDTWAGR
jgi:hypothetical protein